MTGATFVHCPTCGRLMLGQNAEDEFTGQPIGTITQPHDCPGDDDA